MNLGALRASLIAHEGFKLHPYTDTRGKITIGVGRNLTDKGISEGEGLYLLDHDITDASADVARSVRWWANLDEVRQRVFTELTLNMGIGGLLTFRQMLAAAAIGDFSSAANDLLDSAWRQQVGEDRSKTLAHMLATGRDV